MAAIRENGNGIPIVIIANYLNLTTFVGKDEAKFTTLEEKAPDALEMAAQTHAQGESKA